MRPDNVRRTDPAAPTAPSGQTAQQSVTSPAENSGARLLVSLAEEVWRLERRSDRAALLVGTEALRGIQDSVGRLQSILAENSVAIQDETGQEYREGSRLTILHVDGEASDD